jgi:hypothetical protein
VLGDIEIAQGIERDKEKKQKEVCRKSIIILSFPQGPMAHLSLL